MPSFTPIASVALHVSAWVEINGEQFHMYQSKRRTPRECVSWNSILQTKFHVRNRRTPRECVSWNTCPTFFTLSNIKSHSTWVRELKCISPNCSNCAFRSHSTWVRELKFPPVLWQIFRVPSHSTWVRELKSNIESWLHNAICRTPRECVSWNNSIPIIN